MNHPSNNAHEAHNAHESRNPGSFRDPSGFVFTRDGVVYRQVNQSYAANYDLLMSSGLYAELTEKGYLIRHEEIAVSQDAYKVIRPERISFISYPYEWCFSELKDAALLTLKIQRIALRYGMCLKDASAYNIQFKDGRPILIDTLSFDRYTEGAPWVAYRQFSRHFLAPLALMSLVDVRLGDLLRMHIDGVPLDLASKLLPRRSWFRPLTLFHVHMHARSETRATTARARSDGGDASINTPNTPVVDKGGVGSSVSREELLTLIKSLSIGIAELPLPSRASASKVFRSEVDAAAMAEVDRFFSAANANLIWAIGVPFDFPATVFFAEDHASAEDHYLSGRESMPANSLPLIIDLKNPSPALGWANHERASLAERGPADAFVVFDYLHELAVVNNVPFAMIAEFFSEITRSLVIEFIPKSDPAVMKLLRDRKDIFGGYDEEHFEKAFSEYFSIEKKYPEQATGRAIYFMKKK